MKKQVIFDMDGVIFDSEALVLSCWKIVAEKYGLEGIEDVFRMCIGTNHAETMHIVRRQLGETFDYEVFRREASALFHKRRIWMEYLLKRECGSCSAIFETMATESDWPLPHGKRLSCRSLGRRVFWIISVWWSAATWSDVASRIRKSICGRAVRWRQIPRRHLPSRIPCTVFGPPTQLA